jgi:hypothetical protein
MPFQIWADFVSGAETQRTQTERAAGGAGRAALLVTLTLMVAVVAGAACGSDEAATSPRTVGTLAIGTLPPGDAVAPAVSSAGPQTSPGVSASAGATTWASTGGEPSGPTEPTGVPGLDDDDQMCAAWSRYSATLQVLSVAANFGRLTDLQVAQLELIAAPTVVVAVDDLAAEFPPSLESERTIVFEQFLGPFDRRAQNAIERLAASGLDATSLGTLIDDWFVVLRDRDPAAPVPVVALGDPQLEATIAATAASYIADVTAWTRDPSLDISSVQVPLTVAYLASQCPDLSSIGVGDTL